MVGLLSKLHAWQERREILRDLKRRQAEVRELDQFKVADQLAFADSALDNADPRHATEIWNKLMTDYPSGAYRFPLALRVLLRLRRFDEATTMMRNGRQRYPGDPYFLKGLGQIAQAKGDHNEAIMLYAELRKRFPGVMEGYTFAAESLRAMNRPAEAETLAEKAMKQFHWEISPCLEYARTAVLREDWEEALRRWQAVRTRFNYFGGYVGCAQALSHLGRYGEAEELLREARLKFGTDPGPLSEFARVAEAKGDVAEAMKRWKAVLASFPMEITVYSSTSEACERLGEPAEAEATLRAAVARFPGELRPLTELAKLLHFKHRDFPAAAEAWAALRGTFPDNEEAYTRGADALRQAGRLDEAECLHNEHRLRFRQP